MQTFPLLPLRSSRQVPIPKGTAKKTSKGVAFPERNAQIEQFSPRFERLASMLTAGAPQELRDDPSSLSPDRVIVFQLADNVSDLARAVAKIPGLEFLGEQEFAFDGDERFAALDSKGIRRPEKKVKGRLYLAMPDIVALNQLCSLWKRWEAGEPMERFFTPFRDLFHQLREVRPWGPKDRITDDGIEDWLHQLEESPGAAIRMEVEFWFHRTAERRTLASNGVRSLVGDCGGQVLHEACIEEIGYHGMLVELPASEVEVLVRTRSVKLAVSDAIMHLRPQSLLEAVGVRDSVEFDGTPPAEPMASEAQPIAALFDGVPVQGHELLEGRILLDDPDDLQSQALVGQRVHGTAMASLVVHGDLNEAGPALTRRVYMHPVLVPKQGGVELAETDRLLVDTVYKAVLRMKGQIEPGTAPSVFLVNLSLGIPNRPFAGLMSPLARLIDFLSDRYNLLFLVSAGNVHLPLEIPDYGGWTGFGTDAPSERQRAVLAAMSRAKHERTMHSPAESVNALTIGALHRDSFEERPPAGSSIDPFEEDTMPNVSSGLGLGYRRMVKPDVFFPGGREYVQMLSAGESLTVRPSQNTRLFGLKAAAPDAQGLGRLDGSVMSGGTSGATALATRAAHLIFDSLMDREAGTEFAGLEPQYYAVVVKALMVHRSGWSEPSRLLTEICGPTGRGRHEERKENVARFVGFGAPAVCESMECAENRATLLGWDELKPETAHEFRIPLPACLERVTTPRSVTITIGWISPVRCGTQRYRGVRFEAEAPARLDGLLGVARDPDQPGDNTVKRGTVLHERYWGKDAVAFVDDGFLVLHVWCKQDGTCQAL